MLRGRARVRCSDVRDSVLAITGGTDEYAGVALLEPSTAMPPANSMPKRLELARPMMRRGAGCARISIMARSRRSTLNAGYISSRPPRHLRKPLATHGRSIHADILTSPCHVRFTCLFRKSHPDVLMVQSSQDRNGDNGARSLNCSM